MYTVEKTENSISIPEYVEKYVDVPRFLKDCQECPSYGKVWSCAPFNFEPLDLWNRYSELRLTGYKVNLDEGTTIEEGEKILSKVKEKMMAELMMKERKNPGSLSLNAGSCSLCGSMGCARAKGESCRIPKMMRYSLEAIGGNVVDTAKDLLDLEILWGENDLAPEYYVLVGGLLIP